ncbi:MAG: DUF3305 domain-containing protein [Burkholderiaceae bacterium]
MTDLSEQQRRIAVTVIMQCTPTPDHRWVSEKREILAVIPRGHYQPPAGGAAVENTGAQRLIRYDTLEIPLYIDEVDSYYLNISTKTPRTFVILDQNDESGELEPLLVTVSADLAASYESVDHPIEVVEMDPHFYPVVEAFVLTHHIPEKLVKRKRKNWSET